MLNGRGFPRPFFCAAVIPGREGAARANPESRDVHRPISGFRVRIRLSPPAPRNDECDRKVPFTIFVDGMFTTLLKSAFTKAFDHRLHMQAPACLLHYGIAD